MGSHNDLFELNLECSSSNFKKNFISIIEKVGCLAVNTFVGIIKHTFSYRNKLMALSVAGFDSLNQLDLQILGPFVQTPRLIELCTFRNSSRNLQIRVNTPMR